jgi:hypothetical protein
LETPSYLRHTPQLHRPAPLMLHSFKHAAPASVRRPSQDGYRPRSSDIRASSDFRRTIHERQSLDVRRPRHSSSDLYRASRRRASEPGRQTRDEAFQLMTSPRQNDRPLESPEEEANTAETDGVAVYSPARCSWNRVAYCPAVYRHI